MRMAALAQELIGDCCQAESGNTRRAGAPSDDGAELPRRTGPGDEALRAWSACLTRGFGKLALASASCRNIPLTGWRCSVHGSILARGRLRGPNAADECLATSDRARIARPLMAQLLPQMSPLADYGCPRIESYKQSLNFIDRYL